MSMKQSLANALAVVFYSTVQAQTQLPDEKPTLIPFTFNPLSVKRDPFLAPPESEVVAKISELERFEIAQLQLVGVMQGLGPAKAMIVTPSKKTFIVQVGDAIGRNEGTVTRISDSEVLVKESFRDFQGRVRIDNSRLALAE